MRKFAIGDKVMFDRWHVNFKHLDNLVKENGDIYIVKRYYSDYCIETIPDIGPTHQNWFLKVIEI